MGGRRHDNTAADGPAACPTPSPDPRSRGTPAWEHGEFSYVVEAAQAGAPEAAPQVPHKDLGPLVEEELATAAGAETGAEPEDDCSSVVSPDRANSIA